MINRSRTPSQYIFNSQTGALEKAENIKTLAKAASNKTKEETEPYTSVMVITSADNLIHNYFYSFETSWDARSCLQIATIKMPKLGQKNVNYWATYTGQLTIYIGYNFTFDHVNNNSYSTEQKAAASVTKYWTNSDIKPFFRGEIDKIKEYQNDVTIYVKNIGGRFQQEIPEEFRQSYINGQNVRDSFQAICEFLGVPYICPPKTITDSAGEEQTENDTTNDGTENNVDQQLANTNQLVNDAKQTANQAANQVAQNTDNQNNQNTDNQESIGLSTDINDIINGYDDISFDANGAITHASAIIETSPDISHTLAALESHPFERYLDDETGIVEKVNNFLNGEMFEELHTNVMDYGAITIEPKSTTTSDMSTVNTGVTNDTTSQDSNTSSDSSSNSSSSSSHSSSSTSSRNSSSTGTKGVWGRTATGKLYLTQDAINKMSMAEAKRRYEDGKKRNIYTSATMQKLWYRMMFGTKFF